LLSSEKNLLGLIATLLAMIGCGIAVIIWLITRSHNPILIVSLFSFLILGKGAAFGKNREGNEAAIKNYASKHHFQAIYIEKAEVSLLKGHIVKSKFYWLHFLLFFMASRAGSFLPAS